LADIGDVVGLEDLFRSEPPFVGEMIYDTANDAEGSTPLHLTARRGNVEVIQFLMEHGADVDSTT
jgi:ankyrin repeat protein